MSTTIFVFMMMNFAYIGLLPKIFFRRDGKFNLKWWLTASPFFASSLLVALYYFDYLTPWYAQKFGALAEVVAAVLSAASISLISYTLGTHRHRLALWHQQNDRPQNIVTEGAYKYIRHPFYAAFILALLAMVVLCASPWTLAVGLTGLLMLNHTAAGEERRLQASEFGEEYKNYLRRSGRFFPQWHRSAR